MSRESTEKIEEAASAWLVRRDSGDWSANDGASLQAWLEASSLHRVAFWRLEMAWEEAARLKALGAGVASVQPPPRGDWNLTPFFDHPSVFDSVSDSPDSQCLDPASPSSFDSPDPQSAAIEEESPLEVCPDRSSSDEKDRVASIGRDLAAAGVIPEPVSRTKARPVRRILGLATAATALLAVAAGVYILRPSGDRYATPVGGLSTVPLQDGSHITLNTATEVHVALTGKERDIELAHGEAFFEVAKDAKRPFVVNVGKRRVIAVGTQFSVLRDGEEVRVIVSEGTVRIEDRPGSGSPVALPLTSAGSADAVLLSAGSVAHAGSAGVLVQKESPSETQEKLTWRTGILTFRDQTLGEAAAEFNRYNERQIVIRDPAIANLKIEGNFRATNVDAFVRLIESGFPVRATQEDSQILLSSN
jgi:transmembrane sensor